MYTATNQLTEEIKTKIDNFKEFTPVQKEKDALTSFQTSFEKALRLRGAGTHEVERFKQQTIAMMNQYLTAIESGNLQAADKVLNRYVDQDQERGIFADLLTWVVASALILGLTISPIFLAVALCGVEFISLMSFSYMLFSIFGLLLFRMARDCLEDRTEISYEKNQLAIGIKSMVNSLKASGFLFKEEIPAAPSRADEPFLAQPAATFFAHSEALGAQQQQTVYPSAPPSPTNGSQTAYCC